MIYVYTVTEATTAPAVRGLDDAQLECLTESGVSVVLSRHDAAAVRPTADNLWCHEAVAEAAMSLGPVLPTRFGTLFDGEPSLRSVLAGHADRLAAALDHVRGCVEVGARVAMAPHDDQAAGSPPVDVPGAAVGPGTAYLRRRMAAHRRDGTRARLAGEVADGLDARVGSLVRDRTRRLLPAAHTLASLAYLVPSPHVEEVTTILTSAEIPEDATLLCTGPWPPFSFAPALGEGGEEGG